MENEKLTQEQIEELKEAFLIFDTNNDGTISPEELKTALKLFGQNTTDDQVIKMIKDVDKDGNGCIEFPEFLMLMGKHCTVKDTAVQLKAAFDFFDINNDGYISEDELKLVMKKVGQNLDDEDLIGIFNLGDKDGDGKINFKDFVNIMKS